MKTQIELEAYEAKIAAAQANVKQVRENVYSVPSSRQSVYPHIVTVDENGIANYCTCENFKYDGWKRYGHKCYHAQAVERFIAAQQAVKAAEQIVKQEQAPREYVRMAGGGLVLRSAQERKVERGGFSLLK